MRNNRLLTGQHSQRVPRSHRPIPCNLLHQNRPSVGGLFFSFLLVCRKKCETSKYGNKVVAFEAVIWRRNGTEE